MSAYNITIPDNLKGIFNENDTLEVIYIKMYIFLMLILFLSIMIRAFILSFIYNNVLRYGFEELPEIKYSQIVILLISLYMGYYMMCE